MALVQNKTNQTDFDSQTNDDELPGHLRAQLTALMASNEL